MRVRVQHQITCSYETPVQSLIQVLRLTPRSHDGQIIRRWNMDVDLDSTLKASEDAFGNLTHTLALPGPLTTFTISIDGEVETHDSTGVVSAAHERFPNRLYLRDTPMTVPAAGLVNFAVENAGKGVPLERLHALLAAIHGHMTLDAAKPTPAVTTAAESFVLGKGLYQDIAHVFIACSRSLGIPARYVSGYIHCDTAEPVDTATGWAEAFVEGLGWIGFDPVNKLCATEAYVRVAVGLDSLGAAPIRSAHIGSATERLTFAVMVEQVQEKKARQSQRQSQGQSQRHT